MPWWNYLDAGGAFEDGVPPGARDGNSTALTLQLAYVLRLAAEMESACGQRSASAHNLAMADRLNSAARSRSWHSQRGLFADTPAKKSFSQHTNALAILSGAAAPSMRRGIMDRILAQDNLTKASYYFRFYIDEALYESGLAERYVGRLKPWREMIARGLTTTPEGPEETRSDSHAWSAHPNYHLLATVLGVRPQSPGFGSVKVAPSLGELKWAEGNIPHPNGTITVRVQRRGAAGIQGRVLLPPGTSGQFVWNGRSFRLTPGSNLVRQ
jgi:hypothetical protein